MQTQMNNLATSNQRLESMLGNFIKMNTASSSGTRSLPSNTVANPKGKLKAITTRSGLALDGPSVPIPPPFINPEEDEREEEILTDQDNSEFTIKVPPPSIQQAKPPKQRDFMIHRRDPRHPNIPYPSRMNQEKQREKDEVQIHKCLSLSLSIRRRRSIESGKNTPVSENCSAVILKTLPEKLGDPGKFLILCGFSELKCKALADLGASINLMPLSVWKELGLPKLIPTQMTLELANRDPRVPLILGRPFLRIARTLIDVHGEEMILRDGNERLILNMRNDTSSYSSDPHQESINMIDVYIVSHEEIYEDLLATNHPSSNPTSLVSSHTNLTSPKVNDDIFDLEEDIIENFLNLDKTQNLPPYHDNQSSGNPTPIFLFFHGTRVHLLFLPLHDLPRRRNGNTSSSPSLHISETSDYFLEKFADELAHITFPPGNDDLPFDAESDLLELEYLLNHDPIKDMDSILEDSVDENSLDDNLDDTISEMFTDKHDLDCSSAPLWDDYDDYLFDPSRTVNDDIMMIPLDFQCDSVFYEDFSEVDTLPSTNNEDKVFNPGILIHENLFEVTNFATPDKNVKKATNASLILEILILSFSF
ncbi:reverse transcriptase domain-containing protein [Tanacetum coccineum]